MTSRAIPPPSASAASRLGIPTQAKAADDYLPRLDAKGVDAKRAQAVAGELRAAIKEAYEAAQAEGKADVQVEWKSGWKDKQNNPTLRAAVRLAVEDLVEAGYYNIVFQVVNDWWKPEWRAIAHSPNTWMARDVQADTIRVVFSRVGEQRFVVDHVTSDLLSSNEGHLSFYYPAKGRDPGCAWQGTDHPDGMWQNFVDGKRKILKNENAIPF